MQVVAYTIKQTLHAEDKILAILKRVVLEHVVNKMNIRSRHVTCACDATVEEVIRHPL